MLEAVTTRLADKVPELAGRIDGAAEFSRAVRNGSFPAGGASAFLIPFALQGGRADVVTGLFRQEYVETLSIILALNSVDRSGERALGRLRPIVFDVITALAGWAPADELGVFEMRRGAFNASSAGQVTYQLDFSITDQLRISA